MCMHVHYHNTVCAQIICGLNFRGWRIKKNSQFVFSWMHVVTKFILHICTIICNIIYVLKILEYHTDSIRSANIGTVKVESSV